MAMMASLLRPAPLLLIAALLRVALLVYGTYQDAHSAIKYTDIDYLVFTDASRYVWHAQSPYARDTYRYTPLLAWLLLPTVSFFAFGKVVFALADLLAGWLILRILRRRGMPPEQAGAFAALWLWNPMVATISTRGSAEGLLGVLATALVWAAEGHRVNLAAALLGLGVHFKIYPCIWAPAIAWWMDDDRPRRKQARRRRRARFLSRDRIQLAAVSLATFMGLNVLMYAVYVSPPPFFRPLVVPQLLKQPSAATAARSSCTPSSTTSLASTTGTTSRPTTSCCTSRPRGQASPCTPSRSPSSRSCRSRASSSRWSWPRRTWRRA